MIFVMGITLWALFVQVRHAFSTFGTDAFGLNAATLNGVVGLALIGLAVALLVEAVRVLLGLTTPPALADGAGNAE